MPGKTSAAVPCLNCGGTQEAHTSVLCERFHLFRDTILGAFDIILVEMPESMRVPLRHGFCACHDIEALTEFLTKLADSDQGKVSPVASMLERLRAEVLRFSTTQQKTPHDDPSSSKLTIRLEGAA